MTDKELIKQEIERRTDLYSIAEKDDSTFARMGELSSLIYFIDSLPEEHNEDLEEEIENYIKDSLAIKFPTTDKEQIKDDIRYIAHHFAEWQKQQMMKDAVNGEVVYEIGNSVIAPTDIRYKVMSDRVYIPNVKLGDKVKIIILKEEQ